MEKRDRKRTNKRLFVKFGKESPDKVGFTGDISSNGIFIKTNSVFNPGTPLRVELTLPNNKTLPLHGKVMWAKKVPPSLYRFAKKSGMGILIQDPPPEYSRFIEQFQK